MAGATVSPSSSPPSVALPAAIKPRVIILGGTGRVGASTAAALSRLCPSLRLVVAGRNRCMFYIFLNLHYFTVRIIDDYFLL
ncbi:hypothetical protein AXF42_Ash001994 [Apostasia shenzhenica]|uniref:Saccharopine dehydrogenase NADP binding domain-containing protein n=1 Tax=Apostasia shenzhenica TaxID=1088818 RepID=A0A2I0ABT6_9ASPA|nr:hypothetical protein AXF42_Ash001994 [Apostasia shenzhenica]